MSPHASLDANVTSFGAILTTGPYFRCKISISWTIVPRRRAQTKGKREHDQLRGPGMRDSG
jgi:hypothetical protein